MRIQSITNVSNTNYQVKKVGKNNIQPSFQGYVNGNYYKDEIIALAKKYRYSSTWKDELRKGKESIKHAISNWHNEYANDEDGIGRTITAVTSFGLSELIMNTATGVGAAVKNRKIEKMINEIAKCIDDLRYDP